MMPNNLSDDELSALSVGSGAYTPGENIDEPSPEIVERAKHIVDEVRAGRPMSEVTHSGERAPSELGVAQDQDFSTDDKHAFIAHILHGVPFTKTYEVLGGRMRVTFGTVEPDIDYMLKAEVKRYGHERSLYMKYLMAASLKSIETDTEGTSFNMFSNCRREAVPELYKVWYTGFSREKYAMLRDLFKQFREQVDTFVRKCSTPDFWPTP